jgi:UDP-3-O-[3-hydroxymyristoyl] glucosamine N-acyltransferase
MIRKLTAREIAERTGGEVEGDPDRLISGARAVESAGPEDLVYVDGPQYLEALQKSRAGAVLAAEGVEVPAGITVIRVRQPSVAFASILDALFPRERAFHGVAPGAFVGKDVELGAGVGIGPGAYIGDGARIGARTEVHPCATVAPGVVIGEDCVLHSGVHIYSRVRIGSRVRIHSGAVIGADGFGYVQERIRDEAGDGVRHRKVPQVGIVDIEDDVEIGANTTIDRAALEFTRIGRGSKIDNLAMVGHNVIVGSHCLIVAQAGISGSTVLGDYVTVAGQAGIVGHITIGSRATIAAQAGVSKSVPEEGVVVGSPAMDIRSGRRALPLIERLPEYKRAISELTKRIEKLEGR